LFRLRMKILKNIAPTNTGRVADTFVVKNR